MPSVFISIILEEAALAHRRPHPNLGFARALAIVLKHIQGCGAKYRNITIPGQLSTLNRASPHCARRSHSEIKDTRIDKHQQD